MTDPTTPGQPGMPPEQPDYNPGPEINPPCGPEEMPPSQPSDPGDWRPHTTTIGIIQSRMELF